MKDKIITFLFLGFIFIFSVLHILIPDLEISKTERRKLELFPVFQFNSEYITKVDKYLLDHFPFREELRSIKAVYNYKLLNKLDNNGIYLKDGNIYKSDYPTNKKSINSFINKINKLDSLLSDENKVYMMIIPDKNYYLDEEDFLHIDYEYIYHELNSLDMINIEIRDILNIEDYYETDTHWKQENLDKVVKRVSDVMGLNYEKINYNKNQYDNFYGVYYGESAMKRHPEEITYLTNETLNNSRVEYLENENLNTIYNYSKVSGLDAYDVYLDGASSFIEIYNDNANTTKELVIFRDSFGSSFAPLLVNYYSKITLIDNRYISSLNFDDLIQFTNQDILFMYSTLLINNSGSLKG